MESTATEVIPANDVPFAKLCDVLESLHARKVKKNHEQNTILLNLFQELRMSIAEVPGKKNTTLFPILRLLLPNQDRERNAYNMKQAKLGALLVNVLSIKNSNDAKKLLEFRSGKNSTDFAQTAQFVIANRMGKTCSSLTVGEINEILDKIATAEVGNKRPVLDEAFCYVLKNLNPQQMKWFLRLILKDFKIGMSHNRILAAFHPDAPDLYNSSQNLVKVCEELEDGNTRPLELGVQMYYAVSPMLSERLDILRADSVLSIGAKTYHVETKFDGERFQMHMENGIFEYFSRKGHKYGDHYGLGFDSGLLTPHLRGCFGVSVNSFVLDGEMMGWHKQFCCFGSKAMPYDIKKITEHSKFRPCYCVFDVLYYNGQSLVGPPDKGGLPLRERRKILETMFKDVPGVIQISRVREVKEYGDIVEALNKAIDNQEEGVVVKDTASYYIASKRNAGWYKIKAEYTEDAMTDMDLVIIGADEAENKRQGRAKSFHVACADAVAPGTAPHRWLSVGRVATGFTYEARERVCALLEQHWVSAKRTPPPQTLVFNKEKPDFWIMPEHSIVVTVRATELVRSVGHGTDYTMNFPRVVQVRDDKRACDVMTLDEFERLTAEKRAVIKLSKKRIGQEQIDELATKTRKTRAAKALEVPEQFRARPAGDVDVTSEALRGRKLCILSEDEDCTRSELARVVETHGGRHVENIAPDTWCCVLGNRAPSFRWKSIINSQDLDIMSSAWLRSLQPSDELCTLTPLDMIRTKKATKLSLSRHYDRFGDSYTKTADEETLRKCFEKMEKEEPPKYLTHAEMLNIDREVFGEEGNSFSFLRPCFLHFTTKDPLLELRAKMYGATVCGLNAEELTHVVVSKNKPQDLDMVAGSALIVSKDWLESCITQRKLVKEDSYLQNMDTNVLLK